MSSSQQFGSKSTQGFIQRLLLFKTGSHADVHSRDSRMLPSLLPKYGSLRFLTVRGQIISHLSGSSPQRHVVFLLSRDHDASRDNSNLHHVLSIHNLAYYLTRIALIARRVGLTSNTASSVTPKRQCLSLAIFDYLTLFHLNKISILATSQPS